MALVLDSLQALLLAYVAGVVLSGLRFGWHLYRYTDADDWKEVKIGLWVGFVMSTLLWPLVLCVLPVSLHEFPPAARYRGGSVLADPEAPQCRPRFPRPMPA